MVFWACRVALVQTDKYLGYMNTSKVEADNSADIQIADRIMHTLIVKGISLKTLSEEADISYSNLRRSIHQTRPDRRSLSIQEFHRIADALEVKPSDLVAA